MSLFTLTAKPVDESTAPFIFDDIDCCRHDLGNGADAIDDGGVGVVAVPRWVR